jgi:hypothetical protein
VDLNHERNKLPVCGYAPHPPFGHLLPVKNGEKERVDAAISFMIISTSVMPVLVTGIHLPDYQDVLRDGFL